MVGLRPARTNSETPSQRNKRGREPACLAKGLLCKHEDGIQILSMWKMKEPGGQRSLKSTARAVETKGSLQLTAQSAQLNPRAPGSARDPVSKLKVRSERDGCLTSVSGLCVFVHTHMCTTTWTCVHTQPHIELSHDLGILPLARVMRGLKTVIETDLCQHSQ